MKPTWSFLFLSCALLFVACQKQSEQQTKESLRAKVQGQWMLVRFTDETFAPGGSRTLNEEQLGGSGDSLVFRPNGELHTYDDGVQTNIETYEVISPTKILVEQEEWESSQPSGNELQLVSEDRDANGERNRLTIQLKRP